MRWILLLLLSSGAAVWAGEPVCAKIYTTLRKGPGSQFPVSWKVARNMPFLRTERKNGWLKLEDLDGEIHWAKAGDFTKLYRCVVVKTNVANLRREPSSASALSDLRSVDRYTPFKRVATDREWVQVEDETGRQAWIHESQVWKPVNIQSFSF